MNFRAIIGKLVQGTGATDNENCILGYDLAP